MALSGNFKPSKIVFSCNPLCSGLIFLLLDCRMPGATGCYPLFPSPGHLAVSLSDFGARLSACRLDLEKTLYLTYPSTIGRGDCGTGHEWTETQRRSASRAHQSSLGGFVEGSLLGTLPIACVNPCSRGMGLGTPRPCCYASIKGREPLGEPGQLQAQGHTTYEDYLVLSVNRKHLKMTAFR